MGKVDDMRKLREAQYAEAQRAAKAATATVRAPAAAEDASAPPATAAPTARAAGKRAAATDETGICSSCGKAKPMHAGIIANHQKGLGKVCPGSRKPPA